LISKYFESDMKYITSNCWYHSVNANIIMAQIWLISYKPVGKLI
jgi:hypothetical protein